MAKKDNCLHEKKKAVSSHHNPYEKSDHLMVQCESCGMYRYETLYSKQLGRIDTSIWFKPRILKERK